MSGEFFDRKREYEDLLEREQFLFKNQAELRTLRDGASDEDRFADASRLEQMLANNETELKNVQRIIERYMEEYKF